MCIGLAICVFSPTNFAKAGPLTCGGDKTEADCTAVGGTVVTTGGCTSCSISGNSCPTGMIKYLDWNYYASNTCGSIETVSRTGNCGTQTVTSESCTTKASGWRNSKNSDSCYYMKVHDEKSFSPSSDPCPSTCGDDDSYCRSYLYAASCKLRQVCDCSNGSIEYNSRLYRESETCYSTKSKVACIGSGTPSSAISCTGSVPANGVKCSNDDTGLTANLAWSSVGTSSSGCTIDRKCEYYTPANATSGNTSSNKISTNIILPTPTINLCGPIVLLQPIIVSDGLITGYYDSTASSFNVATGFCSSDSVLVDDTTGLVRTNLPVFPTTQGGLVRWTCASKSDSTKIKCAVFRNRNSQ
ncbi:MAG: hypothetical protein US30_C0004G0055 [Candidatus Moranbacteria bacterium GW2011_GWF2_36_839]|nr:MAG: hypothetical protein US27_C0002G0058 [Candidatus Moranbacteria bacterium GW2011_GWF1_36_78]KKQ17311.1 MAG: hypothetical protein US30_C0004G0055 [Candidatus Moranbacteria bacterium GW2011_GWF2_36_839]